MSWDAIGIANLPLSTVSLTTRKKTVVGVDVTASDAKMGVGVPTKMEEDVKVSVYVTAKTGNPVGCKMTVTTLDTS